jgi:hypothetical protein
VNEKKFKDFLKGNIFYIVIAFSAVIYLLTGLITLKGGEKTIAQILSDSFVYFVMAILISRMFEQQGLINGEASEVYIGTLSSYKSRVLTINPFINRLDKWCEKDNINSLKITRTQILSRAGLSYDECFCSDGKARDVYFKIEEIADAKEKTPKQIKAEIKNKRNIARVKNVTFRKAVNAKITLLSSIMLTSSADKRNARDILGMTRRKFVAFSSAKDFIIKIFTIGIFGYFVIDLIQDFTWGKLIEPLIMIFFVISSGTVKMFLAERFVREDEVSVLNLKSMCLTRFENDTKREEKEEAEQKAIEAYKKNDVAEVVEISETIILHEPPVSEQNAPEQSANKENETAESQKESVL